jgi:Uma2 family endonuclease
MGTTSALVSLEEYLNTSYEPDMEFVDGALVERNVGTQRHSRLQRIVTNYLQRFHKSHRIEAFPAVRLRVTAQRHRVPDVLVLEIPYDEGKFITDVPAITVEIKSPDDKFDDIVDKCFEYASLGVGNILVMDPDHRRAWQFEHNTLRALPGASIDLHLRQSTIDFPFAEMFAELDEA